jgi:UDP-N-acetyl-2-amino-2-deoxyglucuronate dehydrogenase
MENTTKRHNFAIIGVGGYIAPRHLKAIKDTGNNLVAALDPFDSVGILDRYFNAVKFFTEYERFDRHLEKVRRQNPAEMVSYISICSPNYLHDAHCRLALRLGVNTICEKPLVINPWNLDQLAALEEESTGRIFTVLQLRLHPALLEVKRKIDQETSRDQHDVELSYVTSRGPWYFSSWKGNPEKSGGIATNIGIHFFDMLQWIFGPPSDNIVFLNQKDRMSGFVDLEKARVRWYLSVNEDDLPQNVVGEQKTYRSIKIDGTEVEFSSGFTDLHTELYAQTLAGNGFGIDDARPSVELAYQIKNIEVSPIGDLAHPFLKE